MYCVCSLRFQPPPGNAEIQLHKEPPAAFLEADIDVSLMNTTFYLLGCTPHDLHSTINSMIYNYM